MLASLGLELRMVVRSSEPRSSVGATSAPNCHAASASLFWNSHTACNPFLIQTSSLLCCFSVSHALCLGLGR